MKRTLSLGFVGLFVALALQFGSVQSAEARSLRSYINDVLNVATGRYPGYGYGYGYNNYGYNNYWGSPYSSWSNPYYNRYYGAGYYGNPYGYGRSSLGYYGGWYY